jgi:AAA domain
MAANFAEMSNAIESLEQGEFVSNAAAAALAREREGKKQARVGDVPEDTAPITSDGDVEMSEGTGQGQPKPRKDKKKRFTFDIDRATMVEEDLEAEASLQKLRPALSGNHFAPFVEKPMQKPAPKKLLPGRQPFMPLLAMPENIKTGVFNLSIYTMSGERHVINNIGNFGTKNVHTALIIDSGKFNCPSMRITTSITKKPEDKVEANSKNCHIFTADLHCGAIQMGKSKSESFLAGDFWFDAAHESTLPRNLSEETTKVFRKGSDKTRADTLKRVHAARWTCGGGLVLDNFDSFEAEYFIDNPDARHAEAARNLAAIVQLGKKGSVCELTFAIPSTNQESLKQAKVILRCFQHSVVNGHIQYYPYLNDQGEVDFEFDHITEVGGGILVQKEKRPGKGSNTGGDFRECPANTHAFGSIDSWIIVKACADLREKQWTVAGQNELALQEHKAWVVAVSPDQLKADHVEPDVEHFKVFIRLQAFEGVSVQDIMPKPADRLKIQFKDSPSGRTEEVKTRWFGPVVTLPPGQELRDTNFVIFAERQKDSSKQRAYGSLDLAKQEIPNGVKVGLQIMSQDGIEGRLKHAMRGLYKKSRRHFTLLLMGRYDEAEKVPVNQDAILFPVKYTSFKDRTQEEREKNGAWRLWVDHQCRQRGDTAGWGLNEAQKEAVLALANNKSVNMVQGPPGTGKSRTGACAAWSAIAADPENTKILFAAGSNTAADEVVEKIHSTRPPHDAKFKDYPVIRVHVPAAEEWHAVEHTGTDLKPEAERRGTDSKRLASLAANYELASLQTLTPEAVSKLSQEAKNAHKRHIAQYGLSLSEAIWNESANILKAPLTGQPTDEYIAASRYQELVKRYRADGTNNEAEEAFKKSYRGLAQRVMENAKIVVTTCVNVSCKDITEFFKPTYLFVDEASQVPDTELIIAATSFKDIRQIVLLGDHFQLMPIVVSDKKNEFWRFRESAAFARFVGHVNLVFLNLQYRMTPEIAHYVSKFFHDGRLVTSQNLIDRTSDFTLKWREYLAKRVWKDKKPQKEVSEVIFIDMPSSKAWRDPVSHSQLNDPEAQRAVDLAAGFLAFAGDVVSASQIAVIVMYSAQGTLIRRKLRLRSNAAGRIEVFETSTVDAFQGRENQIIICSLVTHGTDKDDPRVSNFFKKPNRLCVAISRSIAGLAVIGNGDGLMRGTDPTVAANKLNNAPIIRDLIMEYRQRGHYYSHDKSEYSDQSDQAPKS